MENLLDLLEIVYLFSIYGLNVVAFLAFWWDKQQSKKSRWRIREASLLLCTFNEPFSSLLAMAAFRHKTKKPSFFGCMILGGLYFSYAREYLGEYVKAPNYILVTLGFYNFYHMIADHIKCSSRTHQPSGKPQFDSLFKKLALTFLSFASCKGSGRPNSNAYQSYPPYNLSNRTSSQSQRPNSAAARSSAYRPTKPQPLKTSSYWPANPQPLRTSSYRPTNPQPHRVSAYRLTAQSYNQPNQFL